MEWGIAESTLTAYPSLLFCLAALGLLSLGVLLAYFEDQTKPVPVSRANTALRTGGTRRGGRW